MSATILIVDDDRMIRVLIAERMKSAGYEIVQAGSGKEMFEKLDNSNIDLIVLDLGLPDEDGIVLARKIRARSNIPLIILTARSNNQDKLTILDIGADDYMTKSVDPKEFLLRIRNLITRTQSHAQNLTRSSFQEKSSNIIRFEDWVLDMDSYTLTDSDGFNADLTPGELKLLGALARNPGRVMRRETLLDALSTDIDGPSDRMIDAFISRIRKKIEKTPGKPEIIKTVTGIGYRFAAKID
jgi:DNA-binding response OmpR family regulator